MLKEKKSVHSQLFVEHLLSVRLLSKLLTIRRKDMVSVLRRVLVYWRNQICESVFTMHHELPHG